MVDNNKRQSLKTLGAFTALPVVTATMSSPTAMADTRAKEVANNSASSPINLFSESQQLIISLHFDGAPVMEVTNTSERLAVVRRIHPGTINVDGINYDLNQALLGGAMAIGAGATRIIAIAETDSKLSEPTHLNLPTRFRGMFSKSAVLSASDEHKELLNATYVTFTS